MAAARIPGEFVPLDVNYAHDRAIRDAGPLAELLFVRGMAYTRRVKSYGHIPDYDLPVVGVGIPNPTKHAASLVRVGLWVVVDHGWTVRSWAKWNPLNTEETRARQSEGGKRGNHVKWHRDGVTSEDCQFCTSVPDRSTDRTPDQLSESGATRVRIAEREREEEKRKNSSSGIADAIPDQPNRDDVDRICEHMADRVAANGAKKPTITKAWRDAARLLIDKDGRTEQQIVWLIDWATRDEFWRANILSLPKFREKFDQLRIKAMSERGGAAAVGAPRPVATDQWRTR